MLLCGIADIQPGMTVVAAIMHPQRSETELVKPGVVLTEKMLCRLQDFGVEKIWIDHDATQDLDTKIKLGQSPAHQAMYERLKGSISDASKQTISAGDILTYRQAVMDLVCELMGNPALATLADRMSQSNDGEMFRHGTNVAYLSVLIGLQMESYIIKQRSKVAVERAKDLTALGIGAMLHDVGKLAEPAADARGLNALSLHRKLQDLDPDSAEAEAFKSTRQAYQNHTVTGYSLLEKANAPATARQVVLTHHQRWDGRGFPQMDQVTRGRITGTQQGEKIHIFSRIVGAADLMDHLLAESRDAGKPAVSALRAFRDEAFESWMDPIIRDAVLRTIPPFPVASHVKLSSGQSAVVIAPNPVQPCLPTLRLLDAETAQAAEPLALSEHRDLTITHLLGEPIADDIFLLPEHQPLSKTFARAS